MVPVNTQRHPLKECRYALKITISPHINTILDRNILITVRKIIHTYRYYE